MTDRLLVDVGPGGLVSISTWLEGEYPSGPAGKPLELVWPLDADALEDLRWYLEDYLRVPFGVYGDRGPQVAGRLTGWGQAMFAALFGSGPARDAYVRMRDRADVEIVFRSDAPAPLGLPWELLRDPDRPTCSGPTVTGGSDLHPGLAESSRGIAMRSSRSRVPTTSPTSVFSAALCAVRTTPPAISTCWSISHRVPICSISRRWMSNWNACWDTRLTSFLPEC